ncbi:WXG100 family type VII secretion target [Longispora sp. NPDC051575]|uniref:WXG100 family type VII secretion target n=1 Tax=Longispora sp. NPDC051575 TaxID=3154943 RepID=UPI0034394C1A
MTTGNGVNVDHSTLHSGANDVRGVRTDVQGLLKSLKGVVEQDLASAWKGNAAGAFQRLMEQWNGDATKLLQALADIADLLDKAGTTHSVNEENNQKIVDQIHNALSPNR